MTIFRNPLTDLRHRIDILTDSSINEWNLTDAEHRAELIGRDEFPLDCAAWCFDQGSMSTRQIFNRLYSAARKTSAPDALVWYLKGDIPVHVGIWAGEETVLSKWGLGDVFKHHYQSVPSSYGDRIQFSKKLDPEHVKRIWAGQVD